MKETLHVYTRVSSEISVRQNNSIPAQVEAGKKRATELGFEAVIYKEEGKSASRDNLQNRPVLIHILELIDEGVVKHLFVTEWDRLTRNEATKIYIKKILLDNKVLIYTTNGTLDLADDDAEFFVDLQALLSTREMKLKNKRVKRSLLQSAIQGKVGGGAVLPYGFKKGENKMMVRDDEEIVIYLKMVEMSLQGIGSNRIAEALNKDGVRTKGSKNYKNGIKFKNKYTQEETHIESENIMWAPNTIITILKNPLYKGERPFKGQIIPIEPVISPEKWQNIQNNLSKNRTYSGGKKIHFYALKGLIRCDRCGRNLYGVNKVDAKKKQQVYQCSSKRIKNAFCGMKSVNINKLDELVWKTIKGSHILIKQLWKDLNSEGYSEKLSQIAKELRTIENDLQRIENNRDALIDLYTQSRIDLEKFDAKNTLLKNSTEELELKKLRLVREHDFYSDYSTIKEAGKKIEELFGQITRLSQTDKAALINLLVSDVRVNYDNETCTHTVKILFKNSAQILEVQLEKIDKSMSMGVDLWEEDGKEANKYLTVDGEVVLSIEDDILCDSIELPESEEVSPVNINKITNGEEPKNSGGSGGAMNTTSSNIMNSQSENQNMSALSTITRRDNISSEMVWCGDR